MTLRARYEALNVLYRRSVADRFALQAIILYDVNRSTIFRKKLKQLTLINIYFSHQVNNIEQITHIRLHK